ncbi:MAG: bifunctional riboflavin kinase/FAD synthetase [Flavobacteriia bacterium]|nr:bifunctional riboflavin kinase/FAD synthetase [Flavobacteriia bacterium]
MEVVHKLSDFHPHQKTILTIGTFDGVHVGHQKIIRNLVEQAEKEKLLSVVLTFFPHPRQVLQKDTQLKMIDTMEEKIKLLEQWGVAVLIILPFTMAFSRMTAVAFTQELLVGRLNISKIIIGYDHRFGRNRKASVADLKQFGEDYDFTVEEIPAQDIASIAVSSTKIRDAIADGEIQKANLYLNRPFSLVGCVISGDRIGRKIGFPTANLKIEEDYKLLPKHGVYLVRSNLQGQAYFGMMNVGNRPTVSGKKTQIETHFFEFQGDLYEKSIQIDLLEKIRDEQKFDTLEALGQQIQQDKNNCLALLPKYR